MTMIGQNSTIIKSAHLIVLFIILPSLLAQQPPCECGRFDKRLDSGLHGPDDDRHSRIFNGRELPPHRYPWQVFIFTWSSDHQRCGGVLISRQHVLTARLDPKLNFNKGMINMFGFFRQCLGPDFLYGTLFLGLHNSDVDLFSTDPNFLLKSFDFFKDDVIFMDNPEPHIGYKNSTLKVVLYFYSEIQ